MNDFEQSSVPLPRLEELTKVVQLSRYACACQKCSPSSQQSLSTECLAHEIVEALLALL
jgi:hypothetical protein